MVIAHHIDDDDGDEDDEDDESEKLFAYYLSSTNSCFTALTTGSYIVGVFIRMQDGTLVAPTTGLTISERFSVSPTPCPSGKYILNHHCMIVSFYTVGAVESECQI